MLEGRCFFSNFGPMVIEESGNPNERRISLINNQMGLGMSDFSRAARLIGAKP
jgi:hypothetical protein